MGSRRGKEAKREQNPTDSAWQMAVAWHSQPSHLAWNRRGLSACSGSAGKEDEAALLLPAHLCTQAHVGKITLLWGLGDLVLQWGFQHEHPARCGQPEVALCPFWSRGRTERSSQGLVLSLHAAGSLAAVTAPFWQLLTPPRGVSVRGRLLRGLGALPASSPPSCLRHRYLSPLPGACAAPCGAHLPLSGSCSTANKLTSLWA